MQHQSRQENMVYWALWGLLFVTPLLSLYVRTVNDTKLIFDWHIFWHRYWCTSRSGWSTRRWLSACWAPSCSTSAKVGLTAWEETHATWHSTSR